MIRCLHVLAFALTCTLAYQICPAPSPAVRVISDADAASLYGGTSVPVGKCAVNASVNIQANWCGGSNKILTCGTVVKGVDTSATTYKITAVAACGNYSSCYNCPTAEDPCSGP